MNKRETGSRYENLAASFLEEKGFRILEKNYRRKTGEIDLIARDGSVLVFAEVKYRHGDAYGNPADAVGSVKQHRIRRTAEWYLLEHGISFQSPCRFDVISILDGEIQHIQNAFGGF